jgi:hypothetical protein
MNFPHPEKKEEIIMSERALIRSPGLLVLFSFLVGVAGVALSAAAATDARVSESYGKLPLQFEANPARNASASIL